MKAEDHNPPIVPLYQAEEVGTSRRHRSVEFYREEGSDYCNTAAYSSLPCCRTSHRRSSPAGGVSAYALIEVGVLRRVRGACASPPRSPAPDRADRAIPESRVLEALSMTWGGFVSSEVTSADISGDAFASACSCDLEYPDALQVSSDRTRKNVSMDRLISASRTRRLGNLLC